MKLEDLYKSYATDCDGRRRAKGLLSQTHWISSIAEFDPMTGQALPLAYTEVLRRASNVSDEGFPKDRLWRIIDHSRKSVMRLIGNLTEEPRRENAYMPIRSVRELDTASFVALSRRPGRNIREKLSDRPYMKAVRHFQSVDTTENQLLKAYVTEIVRLLQLRRDCFSENDSLLTVLQRWLQSDEARSITRWKNLPPNNTLISHKDYRRVWDSWRWLKELDDDIASDYAEYDERCREKNHWTQLATAYADAETEFGEMPVFVYWDEFKLIPWLDGPIRRTGSPRRSESAKIDTGMPTCVDLARLFPEYACGDSSGTLSDAYIWQSWSRDTERDNQAEICLFQSDAFCRHANCTTVTAPDIFFSRDLDESLLNTASSAFARRLKETFDTKELMWLSPDCLNEFDLATIRRSLNAQFSKASPLPYSVAAVLETVDYAEITGSGYSVVVFETVNGVSCATVLQAQYKEELEEALPETRGYVWERYVPKITNRDVAPDIVFTPLAEVDENRVWSNSFNPHGTQKRNQLNIDIPDEEGEFDRIICLNRSPVEGGLLLLDLQNRSGGVTLWRNHIPELMTQAKDSSGATHDYYFVDGDVKIEPRLGEKVDIPRPDTFVIAPWQQYFALYQGGENGEPLEYAGKLISPDLPCSSEISCALKLTYTYGADNPYNLVFIPLDQSRHKIYVDWRPKTEMAKGSSVGPEYPCPLTWSELRDQPKPGGERCDFIEWTTDSSMRLERTIKVRKPSSGEISSYWRGGSGRKYNFIRSGGESIYVNEKELVGVSYSELTEGRTVYFYTKKHRDEKLSATHVSPSRMKSLNQYASDNPLNVGSAINLIRKNAYVPFGKTWSDGRSLQDRECPEEFRREMMQKLAFFVNAYEKGDYPDRLKTELLSLLCYTGADFPEELEADIGLEYSAISSGGHSEMQERPLGYLLSDLGKPWKREALRKLIDSQDERALLVLSQAVWHHCGFVDKLDANDIEKLSEKIHDYIQINVPVMLAKGTRVNRDFINRAMSLTRCLELLLGLLISRNSNDEAVHMVLQPSKPLVRNLLDQIITLQQNFAWRPETFHSRVEIDLPTEDNCHDDGRLLEVLRLYLSGDESVNAIRIKGVLDTA